MIASEARTANFGLLVAHTQNIGDDIQAIAARQFLPWVDYHIDRESLSDFAANSNVYTILNGWFLHRTRKWPPSRSIKPLFISFHIATSTGKKLLSKSSLRYLEQHQPIGTRDLHTADLLTRHGIEAYFSGCLTLTLNGFASSDHARATSGVLVVDPPPEVDAAIRTKGLKDTTFATQMLHLSSSDKYSRSMSSIKQLIKRLVPSQLYGELQYMYTGRSPLNLEHRLLLAEKRLEQIAAARLVITSRLHVALPAAALGTPVIFAPKDINDPRFEGLKELVITISPTDLLSHLEDYIAHPPAAPSLDRITSLQYAMRTRVQEYVNRALSGAS